MACTDNATGFTVENHYWRAFDMNTFTGGQQYNVVSISFGIEQADSGSGTGQPLTVNLYANHGSPFPGWRLAVQPVGLLRIDQHSGSKSHSLFPVTLTTSVPAGPPLELAMEVMTPDGRGRGRKPLLCGFQFRRRNRSQLSLALQTAVYPILRLLEILVSRTCTSCLT